MFHCCRENGHTHCHKASKLWMCALHAGNGSALPAVPTQKPPGPPQSNSSATINPQAPAPYVSESHYGELLFRFQCAS